nr:uncharacterized protein LOC107968259 isoform X1 [Pan troglodytes]
MLQTDQPIREVRGSAHEREQWWTKRPTWPRRLTPATSETPSAPHLATDTYTRHIRNPLSAPPGHGHLHPPHQKPPQHGCAERCSEKTTIVWLENSKHWCDLQKSHTENTRRWKGGNEESAPGFHQIQRRGLPADRLLQKALWALRTRRDQGCGRALPLVSLTAPAPFTAVKSAGTSGNIGFWIRDTGEKGTPWLSPPLSLVCKCRVCSCGSSCDHKATNRRIKTNSQGWRVRTARPCPVTRLLRQLHEHSGFSPQTAC